MDQWSALILGSLLCEKSEMMGTFQSTSSNPEFLLSSVSLIVSGWLTPIMEAFKYHPLISKGFYIRKGFPTYAGKILWKLVTRKQTPPINKMHEED